MDRISHIEKKYVLDVLKNAFATSKNSIYNNAMEKEFAHIFNSKFCIGHVNGTATMHTALHALGVSIGDEVIVPPLTMSSTSLCVLQNGSVPVFADVKMDSFTICPKSIEKNITEKTKAIITVSLYGLSPEYDEIKKICKKYNLFLIEDNAQCFLGYYKNRLVGSFGDFSSYSFQASKHITSGEGGMLTTNNEDFANIARRFSSLGYAGVSAKKGKITKDDIQDPNYDRHISLGYNYRMSELQAAVALGQIERINDIVSLRVKHAEVYDEVIKDCQYIKKQFCPEYSKNSYWSYSIVLNTDNPKKDWYDFRSLYKSLGGDGYYAAWKLTYFEPLFANQLNKKFNVQDYDYGLCPNAEFLQPRMIQLKTNYWNLDDLKKEADILAKTISEF